MRSANLDSLQTDAILAQTRKEAKYIVNKTMNNYQFSPAIDVKKVKYVANKILNELLADD
jgi:hypothetical protein